MNAFLVDVVFFKSKHDTILRFLRLTKDKRVNFVKTDFARWVDEDEQDGAAVDENFASTEAPTGAGEC